MRHVTEIADRLISEAGSDVDREAIVDGLLKEVDASGNLYLARHGARKVVSERFRRFPIRKAAQRFALSPDLFGGHVHGKYSVDDPENGRHWKDAPILSQMETEKILKWIVALDKGVTAHREEFEALVRTARPIWREQPSLNLGEALSVAAKATKSAAAE